MEQLRPIATLAQHHFLPLCGKIERDKQYNLVFSTSNRGS